MTENERFYGRRHGKKLKGTRIFLMEKLLPLVEIKKPNTVFDLKSLYPFTPKAFWLEVGFGGGEHLAQISREHKDIGFIGAEPFINGVASLLAHLNGSWGKSANEDRLIAEGRSDNVRIYADDVRQLFPFFKDESFERIFVLYPDPWPKARHEDRRFLGQKNLKEIARLLVSGGELCVATDVASYAVWTIQQAESSDLFIQTNEDIYQPPADWITTRYEQKGLKVGHRPVYLTYVKK